MTPTQAVAAASLFGLTAAVGPRRLLGAVALVVGIVKVAVWARREERRARQIRAERKD